MVFATLFTEMGGGGNFPPAISGSRLDSNEIPTATPYLGVHEFKGAIPNTVLCNRKSEIQDGGR